MRKQNTAKSRTLALLLCVVTALAAMPLSGVFTQTANAQTAAWDGSAAAAFAGGDGTAGNPYQIATAGQLKLFSDSIDYRNPGICAVLTADIVLNEGDLSGYDGISENTWVRWTPIGDIVFSGTFDGQGHVISGLYIDDNTDDRVGLFAFTKAVAVIKNVGVINSYINGHVYAGGLCGMNYGLIANCFNTGTVNGDSFVGGVCGKNEGIITDCYSTGKISAEHDVGGVCGWNEGTITSCYNTGSVTGGEFTGGICGDNSATATGCYYLTGTASFAFGGEESGTDVDGSAMPLGPNDMAGESALTNMGFSADAWYTPADNDGLKYFPQLKIFENNPNAPLQDNAVHISTAEELKAFAARVTAGETTLNGVLDNDIVLNEGDLSGYDGTSPNTWEQWTPIGYYDSTVQTTIALNGTFDGQGHTVSGVYYNNDEQDFVGLFALANTGTVIKNIGIVNSYIKGAYYVGSVCGYNSGGTVKSCYNTGTIVGTSTIGGICGNSSGIIENCYNTGAISTVSSVDGDSVGGICGYNDAGSITLCFNTGTITGTTNYLGGVCGNNAGVRYCYYLTGTANRGLGSNGTEPDDVFGFAEPLTLGQMTGTSAITNMSLDESIWNTKTDTAVSADGETEAVVTASSYFPQLKVFGDTNISVTSTFSRMKTETVDEKEYYLIYNAAQLKTFANIVNGTLTSGEQAVGYTATPYANGKLMANIVLNPGTFDADGNYSAVNGETPDQWTPIGSGEYYNGSFDGQNHTVSGLYFYNVEQANVGLFGKTETGSSISNIGVINSCIKGNINVGGVCGYNNYNSTMTNCFNTGLVSGSSFVGGVCGLNEGGTMQNCRNTGKVSGSGDMVGGVAGSNDNIVIDCYNTGTVIGLGAVGGVCGTMGDGEITSCFNIGTVNGSSDTGGVVGWSDNATTNNSYYLDTSCTPNLYGTSKNEDEFKSGEVAYLLNGSVTDSTNVWFQTVETDKAPSFDSSRGQVYYSMVYGYTNGFMPSYFVTIPEDARLDTDFTLSARDVVLNAGKQLVVSVSGAVNESGSFTVTNGKTGVLSYTLSDKNNAATTFINNAAVLAVNPAASAAGSVTLHFSEPLETVKYSGNYSGTLTFTVSVDDISNS